MIFKKLKYFLFSSLICLILIGVESPLFASYEIENFNNLDKDLSELWANDPAGQTIFLTRVSERLPDYKVSFEQASKDLDVHWTLIAAISYQESHWDPKAISRTGVRGLMMLTQKTAKEMGIRKRTDPNQSISGGANYFQKTLERFPKSIPKADRIWMSLAAYNLGFMNLNQARQLIIHGHISVDGAINRVPGMIVTKLQEKKIIYSPSSALNSDLHPVRPGSQETYNNSESEEDDKSESSEKESTEQTVVKDNNKDEVNEKKENVAKEQKKESTK